ncbi:MAG: hypothetical protein KVP17_004504 [Porospora cf. gigantea B]|uniref:uncharacterized protein n=1 Tax=Porospora cf. gigantea B TaxID=2853592 RepID=UPI003571EEC5|nr:MAG: hypothetical protein KVP17_004504 [Porospora cf. gigantea B]
MAPLYALIRTSAASSKKIPRTTGQPELPGSQQGKDVAPFAEALTAFIERHPCGLASAPVPEDLDVATFLGEIKVSARALPGWLRRRRVVVLEDTLASGKTALARRLAPSWADEPSALAEGWLDHCGYYGWNEGDILALPPRPRQNLILALTILGLVRLRQRQPEATEIISSRSLLAIIFQWGHEDSVQVARWFLGAPPLAFYNPDTTSFIVAIFPYEGTPESSRQRKREVRERTREGYHLEDQEREYRRVRIGLERYVCWLKSVYTDVQVVTSAEERLEALKRRQLLPQETVDLISTTAARPLGNKHRPIQWTLDCTSAVQRAVHSLSEATLVIPTDEDEYFVEAGRSDLAIGATLSVNRKGRSFPVAFHSKSVIGPMEHWPIREQEAFAVVEGVRQFDSFLRGRPFTIHTSHASFKWVLQATEGRAASWAKCLTQFDMTIHHKDGATSALAQPLHLTKVQPNLESYTTPPAKDPGDTKGLDESDQLPEGLWSDDRNDEGTYFGRKGCRLSDRGTLGAGTTVPRPS